MHPQILSSKKSSSGFTLIEILVSFTVLGLITLGVAQMMNSALNATLNGYKHMDADTQARMVLDRMAYDIAKMTKRTDVDYYFAKGKGLTSTAGANDKMAFYSESGGYYPDQTPQDNSNVSLVGYQINSSNQLVRLSKGLTWNGYSSSLPAMVFNPSPPTGIPGISTSPLNTLITTNWNGVANGVANGTDSNYQVIGDQIFRLEYCFLVQTSTSTSAAPAAVGATLSGGQQAFYSQSNTYLCDYPWMPLNYINDTNATVNSPMGMKDVTAIIVSIAVLDTKSRLETTNAALTTAGTYLLDDGGSTHVYNNNPPSSTSFASLPLTLWKQQLSATTPKPYLGLPKTVASQVRFYQRYCYLNHLQ